MFNPSPDPSRQPVIVAALRTPIARAFGQLAHVDAVGLLLPLIRRLKQAGLDDVIIGNAAGPGGNIARVAALAAGLPLETPGVTVDRQCGSGLEAICHAARMIQAGAGEIYLAGGVESVSTAPWRAERPRHPAAAPRFYTRARFSPDEIGDPEMGIAAENVARLCGISRKAQDAFALQSHRRAHEAHMAGAFTREIVPIGDFTADDSVRADTSMERLAALRPVFEADGTVTAGNACPLNDGAALTLMMSAERARSLGFTRGIAFLESAAAGVDPNLLGLGPVASTQKLIRRYPALNLPDVTRIEFNEAFAAQVLGSLGQLQVDPARVNAQGGAIALGHPFGASGAVLVTRLFHQMADDPVGTLGLVMIGIGGGLGITALFQAMEIAP